MAEKIYDLLILTDATGSMSAYLRALNASLPGIIRMSALTGCFSRIGVLAYRDYNGGRSGEVLTEWSGWHGLDDKADVDGQATTSRQALVDFARHLRHEGGSDWPEATKTGLANAYEVMRASASTVMLLFTDAPPHTPATGGRNFALEQKALVEDRRHGTDGVQFADWVTAATALRGNDDDKTKQARVFSIVQSRSPDTLGPYTYLSQRTGGVCLAIDHCRDGGAISKLTLAVLLAWMGVHKGGSGSSGSTEPRPAVARVCRYVDDSGIDELTSERDAAVATFWVGGTGRASDARVRENLREDDIGLDDVQQHMAAHSRTPAVADFGQRYRGGAVYRGRVVEAMDEIIRSDVAAFAVNPVFGSLWRAVCSDRDNEARDRLVSLFGQQVDAIQDAGDRQAMKQWLDDSYDYAGAIQEQLAAVPAGEQFPCVYLDPTMAFGRTEEDEDEESASAAKLTRGELLEIGRSCDARILRRLGRVLTQLTYVATESELSEHIRHQTAQPGEAGYVARIPTALAQAVHKRTFWKVLLHAVLPGTMLGPRAAALLAALSLRMGLMALQEAADAELLAYRTWNSLTIPETWNTNCLALLLAADADYEARVRDGRTSRPSRPAADSILADDDRRLFSVLVAYKLAEMNMHTTLTARVGWTPNKTMSALGPSVVCRICELPRSVTIMADAGVCGLCATDASSDWPNAEARQTALSAHVTKDGQADTPVCWVECSVRPCRVQYVVYNPEALRVRAKCHFCRQAHRAATDTTTPTMAPFVECATCLSRLVWPTAYRPAGWDETAYTCSACTSAEQSTIVDRATTAAELVAQNGSGWLLRNDGGKIAHPFSGRSLFSVASTAGTDGLADCVEVLPAGASQKRLTLDGKPVRNAKAVAAELAGWIAGRRVEGDTCGLCFGRFRKQQLQHACGRRGCAPRICRGCRDGWYGLNRRGRLLHVAALRCPFCRRLPAPATVAAYGLHALGDLRRAVDDAGRWVYAWCAVCGFAKPCVERVCAQGAPAEVADWRCPDCPEAEPAAAETGMAGGAIQPKLRHCPGCDTATEKLGGCDHIQCTACDTHWCFSCGAAVDEEHIYQHMNDQHGGIYGGDEAEWAGDEAEWAEEDEGEDEES